MSDHAFMAFVLGAIVVLVVLVAPLVVAIRGTLGTPMTPTRVAISGGTGTFGKAMIRHLLANGAERIVCLSRDEVKQGDLATELGHPPALRCLLGDVRDKDRLEQAFYGCETVIAAAALKRVDQTAYDPSEVLETNVIGVRNTLQAALAAGVQRVVVLSSDKACEPTNVYGATKSLAEYLAVAWNSYSVPRGMRVAATRYGNVLNSRGSVVEVWRRAMAEGRPLRITDPDVTRFWMTIGDAVALVTKTLDFMIGGELVVPVIPTMRLGDLVAAMASADYPVELLGRLRPGGEKRAERLLTHEEVSRTYARLNEAVYVVTPSHRSWSDEPYEGWPVVPTLDYTSDVHPWRLSIDEMRALLKEV